MKQPRKPPLCHGRCVCDLPNHEQEDGHPTVPHFNCKTLVTSDKCLNATKKPSAGAMRAAEAWHGPGEEFVPGIKKTMAIHFDEHIGLPDLLEALELALPFMPVRGGWPETTRVRNAIAKAKGDLS